MSFYDEHNEFCLCDNCEGTRFVIRHVPAEALFDGDFRHRGSGHRQYKDDKYLTGGTR